MEAGYHTAVLGLYVWSLLSVTWSLCIASAVASVQMGFFSQMSGAWVDFIGAAGSRLGLSHSIWLALASLKQRGLRLVIVLIWQPTSPRTSIPGN